MLIGSLALCVSALARPVVGQTPPAAGGRDLFVLDLAGTPVGEIPAAIKQLNGIMEVVLKDGVPMLKASARSEFLITLPQVLPADFTLEFELVPKACCNPQDLSFEGTPTINQGGGSAHVLWDSDGYLAVIGGGESYEAPMPEEFRTALPGVLTYVGVSLQGSTIRLYTNGRRLYTLDRQFARGRVLRVFLGGQDDGAHAVYLARLRIATGAPLTGMAAATQQPGAAQPVGGAGAPPTSAQSQAASGGTGRVITGVAVTQGTTGPVVTWASLGGVTSYTVRRWKIDDATCCNNTSPSLNGPPWQDGALSVAGTSCTRWRQAPPQGS